MYKDIKEKIKVRADFDAGRIIPIVIKWRKRNLRIKKINLTYQKKEGGSINYFFAVETITGDVLNLRFNNYNFIWFVEECWVG